MIARQPPGVVFWDFDGTIAERPGLWGATVMEILDEHEPDHGATIDQIRAGLHNGWPWSKPDTAHPELADPDDWWAALDPVLVRTLVSVGLAQARAMQLAPHVRVRYTDPSIAWRLFDDSVDALVAVTAAGWRSIVLSNHVPELALIAAALGVDQHFELILSSAQTGYEKPHPEAFRHALERAGHPERVFMVGDNPVADVAGAEAAGIPAILVRREGQAERSAPDLAGAARIILAA